jgi:GAF domain-containing protein
MSDERDRIRDAVIEAARLVHAPQSVDETLEAIVHAAQHTVPGFDHVGVSITHRDGEIETRAGTDRLVWELDKVQYELREGPCYDSITEPAADSVVIEHARDDQRWPRYMPLATRKGLRAQLAVALYADNDSIGGINLYSTESDTIEEDAIHIAELFASHAAIALGRSRTETQLNEALGTRQVIGQAVGILMERYHLDGHRAFNFLIRTSQTGNVKLRDVATELVRATEERNAPGPAHAPDQETLRR